MSDPLNNSPNPFAYWVVQGKLLAGEYPGNQFSWNPAIFCASVVHTVRGLIATKLRFWNTTGSKVSSLIDAGVSTIVDLTEEHERPHYVDQLYLEGNLRCKSSSESLGNKLRGKSGKIRFSKKIRKIQ